MQRRTRTTIGIVLAAAISAMGSAVLAESFTDSVSVLEVQVPVQVTLGREPVRGLTAEDFEVYDRGKRQEILGFEVIDLGTPAPVEAVDTAPAAPAAAQDGRRLLLLFDFAYSGRIALIRALDGAQVMIDEQLHPADRAAVAFYTGSRGVVFVAGFTTDREELGASLELIHTMLDRDVKKFRTARAKLDGLRGSDPVDAMAESFGWPAVLAMAGTALPTRSGNTRGQGAFLGIAANVAGAIPPSDEGRQAPGGILGVLPSSPTELLNASARSASVAPIRSFSEAMSDVVTLLRDVRGVKHLLLFSGGFGGIDPFGDTTTSMLHEFGKIRRSFLRSGWVLHTISIKNGLDPFARGLLMGSNDTLFFLANETGGRLYENFGEPQQATARFLESSSVTYLLTFQPSRMVENGLRHRINVKLVDGPRGARVKHRPAYYAPKKAKRRNDLEQRLDAVDLLFGEQEVEQLAVATLAVALRNPSTAESPRPGRVPVVVEIDGESLLAGQSSPQLAVEIQGYALDEAGGVADFFVEPLRMQLDGVRDRLSREGVRFFAELDLPPGEFRLRLLVMNEESRRFFLRTVPITVRAEEPGLLPPFFVDLDTPLSLHEAGLGDDHLFNDSGQPIFPALDPAIEAGDAWPVYVAGYDLDSADAIELRVTSADGTRVDAAPAGAARFALERSLPELDGLHRFLGTLGTEGLEPGQYRLEVRRADGRSASSPFRVVAPGDGVSGNFGSL